MAILICSRLRVAPKVASCIMSVPLRLVVTFSRTVLSIWGTRAIVAGDRSVEAAARMNCCWRCTRPMSPNSSWRKRTYWCASSPERVRQPFWRLM
ncbi:hypothetical protein D3C72_2040130 [compost metagenome]